MKNKILSNLINFLLIFILCSSTAMAHKSKKHAPGSDFNPIVCIPEDERSKSQISHDKMVNNLFHRLSKLQQDCALYDIEQLKIGKLEEYIDASDTILVLCTKGYFDR